MTGSLNKVLLIGNLGKDPEVRQTSNGNTVVNIALATNERYKDSSGQWTDRTEWHRIVAFGTRADTMGKYLKKGSPVYIEGNLQTRQWEDNEGKKRYTTEIVMRDFQFLDNPNSRSQGGGGNSGGGGDRSASAPAFEPSYPSESTIDDDDIPF